MKSFFSDKLIQTKDLSLFEPEKGTDFRLLVSRPTRVILRLIFPLGCSMKERYREIGYEHAHEAMYVGETIILYDFNRIAEEQKKLLAIHEKDKNFLLSLAKRCEKEGNALMKHSFMLLKKELSKLSTDKLCELFEECVKMIVDYDIYIIMPLSIQKYMEESLDAALNKHSLSSEIFTKYKVALSTPIRSNEGFYEQKNILTLALEYEKKELTEALKKKIERHVLEFCHIGSKYGVGKPWDYNDILDRIVFLAKSNPEKKLSELIEYNKTVNKDANDTLKALNASNELKDLVNLIREFVYMRTLRTDVISGSFVNLMPLIAEIGNRKGYSKEEIMRCLPHEITEQRLPSKEELKERAHISFRSKEGRVYYIQGKDSIKIEKKYSKSTKEKSDSKAKEVKGTIANKGIAKGIARIVIDSTEIGKVKPGDILIAPMTTPNFVPAMEKAAAFVTDEGGILCHAAIVSREMKKPCIIGTKIATKVLKDGDLVEVDANKGVVRKIK